MKIGFIGLGNMAKAMIGGMLAKVNDVALAPAHYYRKRKAKRHKNSIIRKK